MCLKQRFPGHPENPEGRRPRRPKNPEGRRPRRPKITEGRRPSRPNPPHLQPQEAANEKSNRYF